MLKVKILGISGACRKNKTTDGMLRNCLEAAEMLGPWVETEFVRLMDYEIKYCRGCCACYNQISKDGKIYYCTQKDDTHIVLKKLLEADGIIAASPVYWGGMTGRLKTFIDRNLGFCHGSSTKFRGALGKKVGAALSVGWDVHGGMEVTIDDIHHWMLTQDMIVVGAGHHHPHGTYLGGATYKQPYSTVDGYKKDTFGMRSVRGTGKRVAEVALMLKQGEFSLEKGYKSTVDMEKNDIEIDWDAYFKIHKHFPTIHVGAPHVIASGKRAIDKYLEWMTVKQKDRVGETFGDEVGVSLNAKSFKKWMIEDLGMLLLSDTVMYMHDPEFFDEFVKKKEISSNN